jgi:hypothetical protein
MVVYGVSVYGLWCLSVVLFGSILPRFAFLNTNNNEAVASKTLASLLSPTAFAFGR